MSKNLLSHIILDQAAHHNDRLAHEIHEQAHQDGETDYGSSEESNLPAQFRECLGVCFDTAVLLVEPDPFNDRVEGLSDYLGLPYAEGIGESDKNGSEQKSPAVSPEEFFEIREQVFHVLPEWP